MTTELSTVLAMVAAAVLAMAAGIVWWINRVPHIERNEEEMLPLFTGLGEGGGPAELPTPPRAMAGVSDMPRASAMPAASATRSAAASKPFAPTAPRTRPVVTEFTTGVRREPQAVLNAAGVPGTMVEAEAVRFAVPAEGTLQFLPGRFEIVSGADVGREVRFVQLPGPQGHEVTFGRNDGELYRHVQLRDKTVSRQHARMQWRDSHWFLQNLSMTNPVALNGVELNTTEESILADGDRVEMGEVVFRFMSR